MTIVNCRLETEASSIIASVFAFHKGGFHMKSTKPTVSFAESLGILIALLAILGYLIIGQN